MSPTPKDLEYVTRVHACVKEIERLIRATPAEESRLLQAVAVLVVQLAARSLE